MKEDGVHDRELTASESAFIDAHSGTKANPMALVSARALTQDELSADLRDALTVVETAELLGVSLSQVRRRVRERTLYSYPSAGRGARRLLPRWQFVDGREVPHLGDVMKLLPREFTPLDVKGFVFNARVDHPTDGATFRMLDWLLDGQDPAAAVALADAQNFTL